MIKLLVARTKLKSSAITKLIAWMLVAFGNWNRTSSAYFCFRKSSVISIGPICIARQVRDGWIAAATRLELQNTKKRLKLFRKNLLTSRKVKRKGYSGLRALPLEFFPDYEISIIVENELVRERVEEEVEMKKFIAPRQVEVYKGKGTLLLDKKIHFIFNTNRLAQLYNQFYRNAILMAKKKKIELIS